MTLKTCFARRFKSIFLIYFLKYLHKLRDIMKDSNKQKGAIIICSSQKIFIDICSIDINISHLKIFKNLIFKSMREAMDPEAVLTLPVSSLKGT